MIKLPFRIKTQYNCEKWRASTFWTKEPETLAWIDSFQDYFTFWDIGANIGVYSLYCAARFPFCGIHAFEPSRDNYFRLDENVRMNNWQRRVKTYPIALSDKTGVGSFDLASAEIGSSGGQLRRNMVFYPSPERMCQSVEFSTGDAMAGTLGMPNYVKIDVDGLEGAILRGMTTVLTDPELKSVLIEVNGDGKDIYGLMKSCGFVIDEQLMRLKDRPSDNNIIFRR